MIYYVSTRLIDGWKWLNDGLCNTNRRSSLNVALDWLVNWLIGWLIVRWMKGQIYREVYVFYASDGLFNDFLVKAALLFILIMPWRTAWNLKHFSLPSVDWISLIPLIFPFSPQEKKSEQIQWNSPPPPWPNFHPLPLWAPPPRQNQALRVRRLQGTIPQAKREWLEGWW